MSSADGDRARHLLEPGTRLGDLVLVRHLGGGAQGQVFEAWRESLERRVAAKVLGTGLADLDADVRRRLRRESEVLAELEHPNVVRVLGLVEADGHLVQLQELVPGGDLRRWIDERHADGRPLDRDDVRTAVAWCRDLARALAVVHARGIVHRDLKPANVLLTEDGRPKLGDFGLALMVDATTLATGDDIRGTLHTMSPEQLDPRRGDVDARSDVYGLGALLHRLLTGRRLFTGRDARAVVTDVLTRDPVSPRAIDPALPADLEAVCLRALSKSPDDRYPDAAALADDLDAFLEGRPTTARPPGPVRRAVRAARRLGAASSLALAALLGVTWWMLEAGVLAQGDATDLARIALRYGAVAVFSVGVGAALAVAFRRLTRGARVATPAAVIVALALGAAAGSTVHEGRLSREHRSLRAVLGVLVDAGRARGADDGRPVATTDAELRLLDGYVTRWSARLDDDDHVLLARAYLQRMELEKALVHAEALSDEAVGRALALLMVVQRLLGNDLEALEASARLSARLDAVHAGSEGDHRELRDVREILRDAGAFDEALLARLPDDREPVRVALALDAALGLERLHGLTGDRALLEEALASVDGALALTAPAEGARPPADEAAFERSVLLATRARLLLDLDRAGEACEAARTAMEHLARAGPRFAGAGTGIRELSARCCGDGER